MDRALVLLGIVCDYGRISLSDAARSAQLSPSTALRLLRTLEATEFIRRADNGGYSPGPRIIHLGALALSNESLVTLAEDAMERMVATTGESCYLATRGVTGTAIYIAIAEGTHSVRHAGWVGRSVPLAGSAAGAVLNGEVGDEGYIVVVQGVEDDVTAIAAPIWIGHRIVASLSMIVPTYRVTAESTIRIGQQLAHEARSVITPQTPTTAAGTG